MDLRVKPEDGRGGASVGAEKDRWNPVSECNDKKV